MIERLTDPIPVLGHPALSFAPRHRDPSLQPLREGLGAANALAGRPFAPREELERRRARRAAAAGSAATATPAPAPVMVYFDGQDHRTLKKVQELLGGRDIPFRVLDVTDDEATRSWALT